MSQQHTPAHPHESLAAARQAQAISMSDPRLVGGMIQYELIFNGGIVGEIRQSSVGGHIVMIDPNLSTSSNCQQVFAGTFLECANWIKLTGSQPLAILDTATQAVEDSQMTTQAPKVFTHPHLTRLNGVEFQPLPSGLEYLDVPESQIAKMSFQDLDDAVALLQDPECGNMSHNDPWVVVYAAYRNDNNRNRLDAIEAAKVPVVESPVVEEKPMLTPEQSAANDIRFLGIAKKFFKNYGLSRPETVPMLTKALKAKCEELSLALAIHDQSPSEEAKVVMQETLGRNVKGLWKVIQQFKNSPPYLDLVASFEPTLVVSGGNQMGTITEVAGTPVEPKSAKAPKKEKTSTKTKEKVAPKEKSPQPIDKYDFIIALHKLFVLDGAAGFKYDQELQSALCDYLIDHDVRYKDRVDSILKTIEAESPRLTPQLFWDTVKKVENTLGSPVSKKASQTEKTSAKGKAPKKEKTSTKTKEKALLPLPTIADVAALEAMDRKSLMSAMSATNQHKVTGVKGNGKTSDILTALAKHILGVDYVPTEKVKAPKSGKGSKVEQLLDLPTDLQWSEVKDYNYKQLQRLAKIFRSHKLYDGNLAGKGIDTQHLLNACKVAMRALGHEIIEANISKQNPDNAKPMLERPEVRREKIEEANALLAMAA